MSGLMHGMSARHIDESKRKSRSAGRRTRGGGGVPVTLQRVGVESTGSYGAGLLRFVQQAKVAVLEVTTPDKQDRRRRGKNDDLDAQNAAHAALEIVENWPPKRFRD